MFFNAEFLNLDAEFKPFYCWGCRATVHRQVLYQSTSEKIHKNEDMICDDCLYSGTKKGQELFYRGGK